MTIIDSLKMAASSLRIHPARSGLTILGIVIAISAIMMMMSIGKGAENLILNEISGLGAETIIIRPGQEPTGPSDIGNTLFSDSLKKRDISFLSRKENVPEITKIMPLVLVPGSVSYQGEIFRGNIIGGAGSDFWGDAFNVYPEKGVSLNDYDVREKRSVAIIGAKVKEELFGESEALGKNIQIKGRKFRVIGIFPPKDQVAFLNFNEMIIIPYTTAQTYLLGIDYFHEIIVRATSHEVVNRTVRDIEATLREAHGITDPEKDDFFVITQQGVVEQIQIILGALTIFLSSIVAIALVVGGVGIMNIMLVSVSERTREIGLRKALGATEKDILTQFLFEAVLLTAGGGIVGIIFGALLSFGAALMLKQFAGLAWEFVFPISAMILGLGVSAFVGIVFGLYPARQAARKSPIEALRYE